MKTFKRICVSDVTVTAQNGDSLSLRRGQEYLTSEVNEDGDVVVFSTFWVPMPVTTFAGEKQFT